MLLRIKESLKVLFSSNYIDSITLPLVLKKVGISNIKSFVQIGANDGLKNDEISDFIRKYNWRGIMVEPDSNNFVKLVENLKDRDNLLFENSGIGPESSELTFYKIKDINENDPDWLDQIGSFDKSTFLKNIEGFPGLAERMGEERIPVLTFDQLLDKHKFSDVDLLYVDTEGYDYRILRGIDFGVHRIKVVYFETEWMTQFEVREIIRYMRGYNYRIYKHGIDHVGILNH